MKNKSRRIQKKFIIDQNQEDFPKYKNFIIIISTKIIILWNLTQLKNNLKKNI